MHLCFEQAAENVAESMLSLASSEAIVSVTVDNTEDDDSKKAGSSVATVAGATGGNVAGPSGLTTSTGTTTTATTSNMGTNDPMVVVHRGNEEVSLGDYDVLDLASDLALGLDVGLTETLRRSEGGIKVRICHVS